MRCLNRNKKDFYYALYEGRTPITDEYGNQTGEYQITYSDPQKYSANISAAKGETESRQFGENLVYDRLIVMDKDAPAIDEYSILWVDTTPQWDDEGALLTPHDYIVKKVALSLNVISVAISKVTVDG